jgi:hypothetical protein
MGATGAAAPAPQPTETLSNGLSSDAILETVSSN